MKSVLYSTLALAVAAAAVGADCSAEQATGQSCSQGPDDAVGLVQVRKVVAEQSKAAALATAIATKAAAAALGPGCPNAFSWGLLEGAAKLAAGAHFPVLMPVYMDKEFDGVNPEVYPGCSSKWEASASMVADAELALEALTCNTGTCSAPSWLGCGAYDPLNTTIVVGAESLTFEAEYDMKTTYTDGCGQGAGEELPPVKAKVSFQVNEPVFSATSLMGVQMVPPQITTMPSVEHLHIGYANITKIRCSVNGLPSTECIGAVVFLNSDIFKKTMATVINTALEMWNFFLDKVKAKAKTVEPPATAAPEPAPEQAPQAP